MRELTLEEMESVAGGFEIFVSPISLPGYSGGSLGFGASAGSSSLFASTYVSPQLGPGVDLLSLAAPFTSNVDWVSLCQQSPAFSHTESAPDTSSVDSFINGLLAGANSQAQAFYSVFGYFPEHVYVTGSYIGPNGLGGVIGADVKGNWNAGFAAGTPGLSATLGIASNTTAALTGSSWSITNGQFYVSGTTSTDPNNQFIAGGIHIGTPTPGFSYSVMPNTPQTVPGPAN